MVLVIGHRGAAAHAPENTLASFRKALELGADMIELDVHLSSDGELVVIHDDTLDRTTDGFGPVSSMTLSDLRELDAGGGERVPMLREVLELIGGQCGVDIELKGEGTAGPVASMLRRSVDEGPFAPGSLLVTSFNPIELMEFAPLCPEVRIGILVEGVPEGVVEVGGHLAVRTIGLDHRFMTEEVVRECIRAGFEVHAWTVNDMERARMLIGWGVGAIITDRPELKWDLSGGERGG
jgi:glycerophosphoryl diester phosphodiesterase